MVSGYERTERIEMWWVESYPDALTPHQADDGYAGQEDGRSGSIWEEPCMVQTPEWTLEAPPMTAATAAEAYMLPPIG